MARKKTAKKTATIKEAAKNIAEQASPRSKALFIIAAVAFAIIIIYSISTLIYRNGKTKTIIQYAPNAAVVTLNDTRVTNGSTQWLIPGKYHLKVEYNEHLEIYEEDIEITNEQAELYGTLSAIDDEGREYINQHSQEYAKVEGLVGSLLDRRGKKIKDQYPILNYLPMNNSLYSISYQYDDNKKPVVYVKSDPKYLDVAVAKMKLFENVELESENIVFLNENPFEKYEQNPIADAKKFIRAAYQLPNNYVISDLKETNGYTYTSVYIDGHDKNANYAHYLVVIKKNEDGAWEQVTTPQPLFTTYNAPNIDKKILKIINSY